MRDIKFRAWNEHEEKMFFIKTMKLPNRTGGKSAHQTFPLMQFTGFYDNDGKEIYEGDIIEFRAVDSWSKEKICEQGIVEWDRLGWWNKQVKGFSSEPIVDCEDQLTRDGRVKHEYIVGNIYESAAAKKRERNYLNEKTI